MIWVAVEDADTYEVSEFECATEEQVRCLMDGYRVNKHDATKFRLQDTENGKRIVYEGVTHKGGFGYNLWVASKYVLEGLK